MLTFTVVAILGLLLALVLKELFKSEKRAALPKPKEDLANLSISQAQMGDVISISGAGDEFADLDFTVDRRNHYQAGEREWVELSGVYGQRRVYLEVMDDDEVEVHAVLSPKKLGLEDLGLSEDDLAGMDERQNTTDFFEFEGKPWHYRLSKEIRLIRDGHGPVSGMYFWEFQEEGGNRFLSVKKAEGEPFVATVSSKVNPGNITVYRSGGA